MLYVYQPHDKLLLLSYEDRSVNKLESVPFLFTTLTPIFLSLD